MLNLSLDCPVCPGFGELTVEVEVVHGEARGTVVETTCGHGYDAQDWIDMNDEVVAEALVARARRPLVGA